jgi:hypothetical protein
MAYLTVAEFKTRALIPSEYVDAVELAQPGFTLSRLESATAWIDGRLKKRYAVPFSSPYPEMVLAWVTAIVTVEVMIRRGVNPDDRQFDDMREESTRAREEITEAANSETGLFDLPLRSDTTTSGISRGGTFCYSERSPYVGFDVQGGAGRREDENGTGTTS